MEWISTNDALPAHDQTVAVYFIQVTEVGDDADFIVTGGQFVRFVVEQQNKPNQIKTRAWWIALPPVPDEGGQP